MRFRDDLLLKDECYRVMGACFEVYKTQGCGFPEAFYQECLQLELGMQEVPSRFQPEYSLEYKGRKLATHFVPDFVCFDKLILEIKAIPALQDRHRAQLINYLKATGQELGLLVNFGAHPKLEWERILRSARLNPPSDVAPLEL